jgi:DNA-binding XRE family transcriptional regulator
LDFENLQVKINEKVALSLEMVYKKLKKTIPHLSLDILIEYIIDQWLEQNYKLQKYKTPQLKTLSKKHVKLQNHLRMAIKLSGKSQAQIAREMGTNKTYLNHVINGKCEPSITFALLLAKAINDEPVDALFYLEPVEEE